MLCVMELQKKQCRKYHGTGRISQAEWQESKDEVFRTRTHKILFRCRGRFRRTRLGLIMGCRLTGLLEQEHSSIHQQLITLLERPGSASRDSSSHLPFRSTQVVLHQRTPSSSFPGLSFLRLGILATTKTGEPSCSCKPGSCLTLSVGSLLRRRRALRTLELAALPLLAGSFLPERANAVVPGTFLCRGVATLGTFLELLLPFGRVSNFVMATFAIEALRALPAKETKLTWYHQGKGSLDL